MLLLRSYKYTRWVLNLPITTLSTPFFSGEAVPKNITFHVTQSKNLFKYIYIYYLFSPQPNIPLLVSETHHMTANLNTPMGFNTNILYTTH